MAGQKPSGTFVIFRRIWTIMLSRTTLTESGPPITKAVKSKFYFPFLLIHIHVLPPSYFALLKVGVVFLSFPNSLLPSLSRNVLSPHSQGSLNSTVSTLHTPVSSCLPHCDSNQSLSSLNLLSPSLSSCLFPHSLSLIGFTETSVLLFSYICGFMPPTMRFDLSFFYLS